jgi:hypothetical protein
MLRGAHVSDIESNYYWGIDLPGLTEPQAADLLAAAKQKSWGEFGYLVDPSTSLTLHLDRGSVEILLSALQNVAAVGLPEENTVFAAGVRSMIELFEEWTESATSSATDSLPS